MTSTPPQPLHATLVATRREGRWQGALLRGPSGSGKSDLALRALAAGWALVADDRVRLWPSGGLLYGAAPTRLSGLIEVRGMDVVSSSSLRFSRVALVAEVQPSDGERTPEPAWATLEGVTLPCFHLPFRQAGSLVRLDSALDAALRRRLPL